MIKILCLSILIVNSAWAKPMDRIIAVVENEILFESDEVSKYSFVSEPLKEII